MADKRGTAASWYQGWEISEEKREFFRERALRSREAKARSLAGDGPDPLHPINSPQLDAAGLMPQQPSTGLLALSLFSGGGGLDLGFDLAGFTHVASYDTLPAAGETLAANRPDWDVFAAEGGDVTKVDWTRYAGEVDLIHGGPPCQPFSMAGRQRGAADERDMFPEFVRAVHEVQPAAFVAENVTALLQSKFESYVRSTIMEPLGRAYSLTVFRLAAQWFGVPQVRQRVFFVGVRRDRGARFEAPVPTHAYPSSGSEPPPGQQSLIEDGDSGLPRTMGTREALGLPGIGFDALAPTLRSALTGPRHTTSILSSTSANRTWGELKIWPNGVAPTRERAQAFVAENGHFRLSVPDCALLQGFPEDWDFSGPVYMALGQIGNAVAPPVAFQVAKSVSRALLG